MRTLAPTIVSLSLFAVASACVGAGEDGASGDGLLVQTVAPPSHGGGTDDASRAPPSWIVLEGRVREAESQRPAGGRAVVCVDANGKRREAITGDDGAFFVDGVAPPYDLAIAGPPEVEEGAPTILLGVTRRDPDVELFGRPAAEAHPPPSTLHLTVDLPPCPTRACVVAVASSSASGGGEVTLPYADGGPLALAIEHLWRRPPAEGEGIGVDALTTDASHAAFTHGRRDAIVANPGEVAELGTVVTTSIASSPPIVAASSPASVPPSWAWASAAWLDLPGGGSIALAYDEAPSLSFRAPTIPGATFRVGAWAEVPREGAQPEHHRWAQAWAGARPIPTSAATMTLAVDPGPELVRPTAAGSLSRRGSGFEWTPGAAPTMTTLSVFDVAHGVTRWRVLTADHAVGIARLAVLGLAPMAPGEHVLDLTTAPGVGVDDATSPDVAVRRRRFDPRTAGRATYLRAPFRVTR